MMAAIHIDKDRVIGDVRSIYAKKNKSSYSKWVKEGLLLYKKADFKLSAFAPIAGGSTIKTASIDKNKKKRRLPKETMA